MDTAFLVSDGGASKGQYVTNGEILDRFALHNRRRRLRVHAIEVWNSSPDNTCLMKGLAELTGGVYRKVGANKS